MELGELRIGNWVKVDDLPIEQITLETFATLNQHPHTLSLFNGVRLNEDWLIKLGFIKIGLGYRCTIHDTPHSKKELLINLCNDKGWGEWYCFLNHHDPTDKTDYNIVTITRELIYVHELQNIHFALTKKELIST